MFVIMMPMTITGVFFRLRLLIFVFTVAACLTSFANKVHNQVLIIVCGAFVYKMNMAV